MIARTTGVINNINDVLSSERERVVSQQCHDPLSRAPNLHEDTTDVINHTFASPAITCQNVCCE